ncbi:mandelate racemase/muconate lactonizing enzyme family protein [Hellea balneolensis]|uniref:mandelate racemase/muconate lactonizing enzyme family protein n=1 Tax=Hellea balneolensis TaxID=287478 RepID=UPI00041B2DD4|nr:mandelate racemase/muconate lactonizing enzyme family protein [Hellea balneolensis]
MKITKLETQLVNLPLPRPIKTAIHDMRSVGCVLLRLRTDQGLTGEAYLFTLNGVRLKAFDEMVRGFEGLVVGQDPHHVTAIWEDIWAEINPTGHKGVTISALSTIDTACWDLIGKAAEKPLHHIFGACREKISTYASSGLWLSYSLDKLQAEAQSFLGQGFTAMKIRLGSQKPSDDIVRVQAVRDVVGPETGLLVDINQGLTPKDAIRLGRELEPFNLIWIEEPVAAYDLAGHARVTAALDTPIASGETEYTRFGIQAMIEKKACDILMPDLQRIGGLTEMRRVAALAHAHNLPISTHFFTHESLTIAGSAANCMSVEHIDWFAPLFNEPLEISKGEILIPQRPGTGFSFRADLAKF